MRFPRKAREPVDINLAPLIDVVFILEERYDQPLEILVDQNGRYAVNGQALASNDLSAIMGALIEASAGQKDIPVTLSADGKAPHQAVVTAMDAASKLGFVQLRITTIEAQDGQ